ncbi:MAG: ATP synthase F1 subunit gamma [Candidatus Dormibacteraeota bacterium]|nr:ATP synthase F1 subunit gamma [Candidatus Dormibacteraeota bacterium]
MASLRDLRRRIRSVKNTQKITKAMELVAAAKMRRAQERVEAARPYAEEITNVIADIFRRDPEYKHPYLEVRDVKKRLVVLITTDRGLVGALNGNNIRLALREMNESPGAASVVTIGRKGRDTMRRLRKELVADRSGLGDRPSMGDVLPAIRVAMEQYENGDVDQVDLVYAQFISAGRQRAVARRLLPLEVPEATAKLAADFIYEPEPKDVLDALLPRYVESQIYQALLENVASQQAAQMVAMRNASDNANDLIQDLTLTANTVRQSTITTELMEIVGGAAALAG